MTLKDIIIYTLKLCKYASNDKNNDSNVKSKFNIILLMTLVRRSFFSFIQFY